ncbi:hypothetical protein LSAT2_001679 [Lamellibrachia satsuma]|nr:hypothetical protein LSAT2_001679 [Lamellibrachia satsuma]
MQNPVVVVVVGVVVVVVVVVGVVVVVRALSRRSASNDSHPLECGSKGPASGASNGRRQWPAGSCRRQRELSIVAIMGLLCRQMNCLTTPRRLIALNTIILLANLLIFSAYLSPSWQRHASYFERPITPDQHATMLSTLRVLVREMEAHNLTYFLTSGTLIGSYRHHDMIPWDDDIDIGFMSADKGRVRDVLLALEPDFLLYIRNKDLGDLEPWKFYPRTSGSYIHRSFRWPYIDMFFFGQNSTHIWNERPRASHQVFRKCDVFPLQKRPFGEMMLQAPCNTDGILRDEFGDLNRCVSRSFSHVLELPMPFLSQELPCSELAHKYQFVSRTYTGTIVNETLRVGQWKVKTVSLPGKCANPCPAS